MTFTQEQLKQAIAQIQYETALIHAEPLSGGISAYTYKIKVVTNLRFTNWLFRAHSEAERQRNPNITHDEYMLHVYIRPESGVPVPIPIYFGSDRDVFPIPYLITEYIEHNNQLPPSPAQPLAKMLKNIHMINLAERDFSFLPDAIQRLQGQLKNTQSDPIFDTLKNTLPYVKQNPPALLHGDYWNGNILWRDEQIVAVIDWEDMMRGDPLVDLGKSRLEFLWQFSAEMMRDYTKHYQSIQPDLDYTYLPYWDLWGAWRLRDFASWFDDTTKVEQMQKQYDQFVETAIEQCETFTS